MPPTHDNNGRLSVAFPGDAITLSADDCAATLAHLILNSPANTVRLTAATIRSGPARVEMLIGAQPATVGCDTARCVVRLLEEERDHPTSAMAARYLRTTIDMAEQLAAARAESAA